MNRDDPNLTAFAFGELDPEECEPIRSALKSDDAAALAVEETRALAGLLRTQLQAEPLPGLRTEQRNEILQALRNRSKPVVVPIWRRVSVLSAMAACLVVGLAIGLLFPALSVQRQLVHPMAAHHSFAEPVFKILMGESPATAPEPVLGSDFEASKLSVDAAVALKKRPISALTADQGLAAASIVALRIPEPSARVASGQFASSAPLAAQAFELGESTKSIETKIGKDVAAVAAKRPERKRLESATVIGEISSAASAVRLDRVSSQARDRAEYAFIRVADSPVIRLHPSDKASLTLGELGEGIVSGTLPSRESLAGLFGQFAPLSSPNKDQNVSSLEVGNCPWAKDHRLACFLFVSPKGDLGDSGMGPLRLEVEFNPVQVAEYRLLGLGSVRLPMGSVGSTNTQSATLIALFELIPVPAWGGGSLKYQPIRTAPLSAELLTFKVGMPGLNPLAVREFPLRNTPPNSPSREFRFFSALAGFGLLLNEPSYRGPEAWEQIERLAVEGAGEAHDRAQFVALLKAARHLAQ